MDIRHNNFKLLEKHDTIAMFANNLKYNNIRAYWWEIFKLLYRTCLLKVTYERTLLLIDFRNLYAF